MSHRTPERLSPNDTAFFVAESVATPQVTALLTLLGRTPSLAGLRQAALRGTEALPRMRCISDERRFGVLLPAGDFDLDHHVTRLYTPEIADRACLLDTVARLHSEPLDRSRPLWQIVLLSNRHPETGGLPPGAPEQAAILWRIHHGLTDGIRALHTFQTMLGGVPPAGSAAASPRGDSGGFFARASRAARVASRTNSMRPIPSPLKGTSSAARRLTPVDLDRGALRDIMRCTGAFLHDVVLALLASALRRYHERHGASTAADLRVIVPANSRPLPDGTSRGNFVDMLWIDLPIAEPDPVNRLHRVGVALRQARKEGWVEFSQMFPPLIARAPIWMQRKSFAKASSLTTAVCTILPGSIHRLSIDGQTLSHSYAAATLLETHGAGFTFMTAGPVLRGAIVSDPAIVTDAEFLAACLVEALDELALRLRPRQPPASVADTGHA